MGENAAFLESDDVHEMLTDATRRQLQKDGLYKKMTGTKGCSVQKTDIYNLMTCQTMTHMR